VAIGEHAEVADAQKTSGQNMKVGRHVGLDFYDLLTEALIDPVVKECHQKVRAPFAPDRPSHREILLFVR